MRFLTTLVFSFLLSFSIFGQQLKVNGIIIQEKSNEPLSQVQVQSFPLSKGVVTNDKGYFEIDILEGQDNTLVFSHISFEELTIQLKPGDQLTNLHLMLTPKVELLQEVEIMGVSTHDEPYRTEQIGIETLEKTNLQDIGSFLRNVPNVNGVKKGAMGIDPVIRGFKYSQLNVQVNGGTRIEGGCPNRMDPATAHIDISDLKDIQVVKGPFALKYGVNFGGIIDMTTYKPVFYEKYQTNVYTLLAGQTNHEGFKTKVGVSGANDLVTYSVSGSWKKYGDYFSGDELQVPAALEQQTYAANLGFKLAKKHILYAGADFSQGQNIDFPTLPMDERNDDTKIYSLNYIGSQLGKSINFIRFKAYLSDVNHEMDNKNRPFSDTVVAVSNIHAMNAGGKIGVNFSLGEGVMEIGGDYEMITKDGERVKYMIMQPMLPKKVEDLWNDAQINNLGLFVEYSKKSEKLDWVLATRVDFNSAQSAPLTRYAMNGDAAYMNTDTKSDYVNFSASAGLTWHLNRNNDVVFSLGRGARSPDMSERFIILLPIGYDPYDYIGNPQLKPEVNHEADLGYRFNHKDFGNVDVSTFFSLITNYIVGEIVPPSVLKPQTSGVLGVKEFQNYDMAFLTGFELTYQTPVKYLWEIRFNAAYTMGWLPEDTIVIVEDGVAMEKILKDDPMAEIPPFELNVGFAYKFFHQKFTPAILFRYVAAQNRVSEAFAENKSEPFTLLSLELNYRFNQFLKINAGVKNLLNVNYYEHLNRNIIGTTLPLYEPGRVFYANIIFTL